MNESMNKNDVVFVSDLCGGTAEVGVRGPRRGTNVPDEVQFTVGQGVITRKEGSSMGGPRNAFSGA